MEPLRNRDKKDEFFGIIPNYALLWYKLPSKAEQSQDICENKVDVDSPAKDTNSEQQVVEVQEPSTALVAEVSEPVAEVVAEVKSEEQKAQEVAQEETWVKMTDIPDVETKASLLFGMLLNFTKDICEKLKLSECGKYREVKDYSEKNKEGRVHLLVKGPEMLEDQKCMFETIDCLR